VKLCVVSGVLLLVATAARADIVEWKDSEGVRHYTNVEAEVPPAYRQTVQVVVNEQARRVLAAESTEAPVREPTAAKPAKRLQSAEVANDWPPGAEAYLAGLERGLQLGRAMRPGGDVNINGPLAVASAGGAGAAVGYFLPSPSYPLVTTSFDRGRSRHRTLRMLLQDQFAIDQEGPFGFDDQLGAPRTQPPLGVSLSPFLPRGLPHRFARNVRVITR
jgi:hypothetical protein